MKKTISSICLIILSISVGFTYTPSNQDQQLISLIEFKIDELSLVEAAQISQIVSGALDRFESGTRKYRFAESIISYLENGILSIPEIIGPSIKNNDSVRVEYTGLLTDGEVFDTSLESVAREAGIHNPSRYYEPLTFTVGAGQMISGFDKGVVGMREGETKTLIIPPEQAYGFGDHFLAGQTLEFEITIVGIE